MLLPTHLYIACMPFKLSFGSTHLSRIQAEATCLCVYCVAAAVAYAYAGCPCVCQALSLICTFEYHPSRGHHPSEYSHPMS